MSYTVNAAQKLSQKPVFNPNCRLISYDNNIIGHEEMESTFFQLKSHPYFNSDGSNIAEQFTDHMADLVKQYNKNRTISINLKQSKSLYYRGIIFFIKMRIDLLNIKI